MKRTEMIRTLIIDAAKGDKYPLRGLIDWLIYDKHISMGRIFEIAERRFRIPKHALLITLIDLH